MAAQPSPSVVRLCLLPAPAGRPAAPGTCAEATQQDAALQKAGGYRCKAFVRPGDGEKPWALSAAATPHAQHELLGQAGKSIRRLASLQLHLAANQSAVGPGASSSRCLISATAACLGPWPSAASSGAGRLSGAGSWPGTGRRQWRAARLGRRGARWRRPEHGHGLAAAGERRVTDLLPAGRGPEARHQPGPGAKTLPSCSAGCCSSPDPARSTCTQHAHQPSVQSSGARTRSSGGDILALLQILNQLEQCKAFPDFNNYLAFIFAQADSLPIEVRHGSAWGLCVLRVGVTG